MSSSRSSVRWSFAANWAQQGINAGFTFVLAALLGPEAYGIAAIAMIFIMFSQILVGQGLNLPLIQRTDLLPTHRDSAFWALLCWAVLLTCIAASLSGWWGRLNGDPLIAKVMLWLSPLLVIQALSIVPKSQLTRKMDFRALALVTFVSATLGGAAGVVSAFKDAGVWSLVIMQWCTHVAALILLWGLSRQLPGLAFSLASLKQLLYSANGAFLNQLGGFTISRADSILVGVFFGPVAVGLYRLADRLVQLLMTLLSRSITGFALPYLSRAQGNAERVRQGTEACLELSSILSIPMMAMLAVFSPLVFQIIGEEWAPAWIAAVFLSVVGAVQSLTLLSPQLLNAMGRSHLAALISWVSALLQSALFLVVGFVFRDDVVFVQIAAISGAKAAFMVLVALPFHIFLIRAVVDVPARETAKLLLPPCACALVGGTSAALLLLTDPFATAQPVLKLGVYGAVSATIMLSLMTIANRRIRGELSLILEQVSARVRSFSTSSGKAP